MISPMPTISTSVASAISGELRITMPAISEMTPQMRFHQRPSGTIAHTSRVTPSMHHQKPSTRATVATDASGRTIKTSPANTPIRPSSTSRTRSPLPPRP